MDSSLELAVQVGQWNMLWEAGQFRRRLFDADELPGPLVKIADLADVTVIVVPRQAPHYRLRAARVHGGRALRRVLEGEEHRP